ncbi:MAG: nitrous oxide reductase accessory protein NosL [Pseudomonadota bacterium]
MKHIALIALVALAACKKDMTEAPAAVVMTEDALGHFCQMQLADHPGPKGQIHLEGMASPIFFGQVRDMIAYLKAPERDAKVLAVYVSDMGIARSWHAVEPDNWIAAAGAKYVINAGVAGGMGGPEIVPFASASDAAEFVAQYGGSVVSFDTIPDEVAVGPVDLDIELDTPA